MSDTDGIEDVESYILSSKYRLRTLEHLAGTVRATPTDIADSIGVSQSHISRALSELQEKGVVELRVPEGRTVGRYYGLTEKGEDAWPEIKRQIRSIEWTIEEPSSPATRSVVGLAKDEFGEWLRSVGLYDGDEVTIFYIDPEVRSSYSDEELEEALRTLIFDHSMDDVSIPSDDCWSEVLNFADFSVIRVRINDEYTVWIAFDRDQNVSVPDFAESVAAHFDT
ncbi:helix-turn-helix domain-containing protein [Halopenitus persicus]|nr:helix-turn-helix domain-containing protein [Halopenitus persicus]